MIPPTTGPFGNMLTHYAEHDMTEWLWPHLEACARHGVVHMTEDTCLLARPVVSKLPVQFYNELADLNPKHPDHRELTDDPDAWHILYASGEMKHFFEIADLARPLPLLLWQRGQRTAPRLYNFNQVKRHVLHDGFRPEAS